MWDFIVLFEVFHAFLNSWQAFCMNLLLDVWKNDTPQFWFRLPLKCLLWIYIFFFEVQWHNGIFHVFIHLWSFLNGLLPQLTTVKKGNLYLMIYLSSAYFTLKWDSIIPARNRWPWRISQVLCIFQYKS